MDSLRWILLGLGVVVVAGIYIYAQIAKQRRREPEPSYEQVDWEQDSVQGLSESEEEFYDDLPSMDALNSARATHRAEGNSIAPNHAAPASADFEDTQEIPVLEEVVGDEPEESLTPINPALRNNLLLGSLPVEPVMGTPISQIELEGDKPGPSMHADSLASLDATQGSTRTEPSFADLLGLDGGQMAEALQRRRQPSLTGEGAKKKSPVQNAFSFDGSTESASGSGKAGQGSANAKLEQAANQRLQQSSAERVVAKANALQQQAPAEKAVQNKPKQAPQEEVVVLHVKASDSIGFYGPEMAQCFDDIGIKFGEMDIYHYQSGGQRLLSVANMVKPGTFDPNNFTGFTTPGISLFLQLRPESDFELSEQVLVKSAQYIAYKLKGEVLTAGHEVLDNVRQGALSRDIADIKSSFAG